MSMTQERQGEVALRFLKHQLRQSGLRLKPDMKREVGNTAKAIDVSVEEAMEFTEILVRELVEEIFPSRPTV